MLDHYPDLLEQLITKKDFTGVIPRKVITEICKQTGKTAQQLQLDLLPIAASFANPPISNFFVGIVVEGKSGNFYFGANLEFPEKSLALTAHAEQIAVANALLHQETGLTILAGNAPPCGSCRQFLNELATPQDLLIILPNKSGPTPFIEYLPGAFGPKELGVEGNLFGIRDHKLNLEVPSPNPLASAALDSMNKSYAPYTNAYAGVAIRTKKGQITKGTYIENVAFNPSLTPIIPALMPLIFSRQPYSEIQEVVLVEKKDSVVSQKYITGNILHSIAPAAKLSVLHSI